MKIGLFVNTNRDKDYECARRAIGAIISCGATPVLRPHDAVKFPGRVEGLLFDDFTKAGLDVVISIGGDGTFLAMVSELRDTDADFIGINKGSIGFLAQVNDEDVEDSIKHIAAHDYKTIARTRLLVQVYNRKGVLKGEDICLNDCAISRGARLHVTKLLLRINGQNVERFFGDGLVVATATGSTAYSLSAGGPLVMPDQPNIIVTSVCSNTFQDISYVAGPDSKIEVDVEAFETAPIICPDGRDFVTIEPEDHIVITRYEKTLKTILIGEDRFFNDVRRKLVMRGSFYENS